jgi:hypothetical protein
MSFGWVCAVPKTTALTAKINSDTICYTKIFIPAGESQISEQRFFFQTFYVSQLNNFF